MSFLEFAQFAQQYYLLPLAMVIFLIIVLVLFWKNYSNPAKKLMITLKSLEKEVKTLDSNAVINTEDLDKSFSKNDSLKQAWDNYKRTFHDVYETVDGEDVRINSLTTVPSEVFFTESIVVDIPLKVDFYKHLPPVSG